MTGRSAFGGGDQRYEVYGVGGCTVFLGAVFACEPSGRTPSDTHAHGRYLTVAPRPRFRNVRSSPATVCVRKWDDFGDWHYFTRMTAAVRHARNPRDADVTVVNEYFYDYNP